MNKDKIGDLTKNPLILGKSIFLSQFVARIQLQKLNTPPLFLLSYSSPRGVTLNTTNVFFPVGRHQSFREIHRKDRKHRADQVLHLGEIAQKKLVDNGVVPLRLTCR